MIMNGNTPTLISGVPKRADSLATIRSHASASPSAPARTCPLAAHRAGLPSSPTSVNSRTKRLVAPALAAPAPAACALVCAFAAPATAAQKKIEPLNQYVVKGGDPALLAQQGYDLNEGGVRGGGRGIVATPSEADALRAKGFTVTAPYGEM